MRATSKLALISLALCLGAGVSAAQQTDASGNVEGPIVVKPRVGQPPPAAGESSSNQTKIDLRPPMGDLAAHPDAGRPDDEAAQQRAWDPHRAAKDVEVGDFYYRNGNYTGALGRYREALEYKPRDADATLKLARTLERRKAYAEARERYQQYLEILKDGPGSGEARQALERLKQYAAHSNP